MIAMHQLLARIPKVLLLVPVTLVTRATAKPVAAVSCLTADFIAMYTPGFSEMIRRS